MAKRIKTSQYYGVHKSKDSRIKNGKVWIALIHLKGTSLKIGAYEEERDAAIAVDKKLISLGKTDKLNILKPKK